MEDGTRGAEAAADASPAAGAKSSASQPREAAGSGSWWEGNPRVSVRAEVIDVIKLNGFWLLVWGLKLFFSGMALVPVLVDAHSSIYLAEWYVEKGPSGSLLDSLGGTRLVALVLKLLLCAQAGPQPAILRVC